MKKSLHLIISLVILCSIICCSCELLSDSPQIPTSTNEESTSKKANTNTNEGYASSLCEQKCKLGNSQGNMQCFGTSCYDGKDIYFGTYSGIYKIDSNGMQNEILSDAGLCFALCNVGNRIIYTEKISKQDMEYSCHLCSLNKSTEDTTVLLDLGIHNDAYILNSLGNKIYYNIRDIDDEGDDRITTYVYDLETGKREYYLDDGWLMTEKGIYYTIRNDTDNTIMFRSFEDNAEQRIIQIDAFPILQVNHNLILKINHYDSIYKFDLNTKECIPLINETGIDFVIDYGNDLLWSNFYTIYKCDINGNNSMKLVSIDPKSGEYAIPNVVNGKIVYFSFPAKELHFADEDENN